MTPIKLHTMRVHSVVTPEDRRRSQRVMIRVPVTIVTTENGQMVRTAGKTIEVSSHGAMVACARSFDSNTKMEVVNDRTGQKVASCVSRSPRESAEGFLLPLEFTSSAMTFWQISFPPANWKPEN